MNRVYNPCRVVAQAPASGCGEYRKDDGSLEVFPLTAVLCDFALERSPGPFPPPAVIGSVSIHLLASLIYYFLSPARCPHSPFYFSQSSPSLLPSFTMTRPRSFVLIHNRALYLSFGDTHHLSDVFNPCVCP